MKNIKGPKVWNIIHDPVRDYVSRCVVVDKQGDVRPVTFVSRVIPCSTAQSATRGDLCLVQVINKVTSKCIMFNVYLYGGYDWHLISIRESEIRLPNLSPKVREWLSSEYMDGDGAIPFGWDGRHTNHGNWLKYRLMYLLADAPQAWLNEVADAAGYWSDLHTQKPMPIPSSYEISSGESLFIRYSDRSPEVISAKTTIRISRTATCLLSVKDNKSFPELGFPKYGNRWEIYGDVTAYQRGNHETPDCGSIGGKRKPSSNRW